MESARARNWTILIMGGIILSICPGCLVVPLPIGVGDVLEGRELTRDQVELLIKPDTTREIVISELGQPDLEWIEARIIAYHWDISAGQLLWFIAGGYSAAGDIEQLAKRCVLAIQFDENNEIVKFDLLKRPMSGTYGKMLRKFYLRPIPETLSIPDGIREKREDSNR